MTIPRPCAVCGSIDLSFDERKLMVKCNTCDSYYLPRWKCTSVDEMKEHWCNTHAGFVKGMKE